MLIEMGIADAYGIGWEFIPAEGDIRLNSGRNFYQNPKYPDLKPGFYTDDTQRALANARVLLEGDPFSIRSYADAYVSTFKADPRNGYSRRYQKFIESVHSADEFIEGIVTTAESNGSIMGVLPLGFLPTAAQVRAAAAVQAMTTHAPSTVPYAQSLALAAHFYLHRDKYEGIDVDGFVNREMRWPGDRAYSLFRAPGPVKMTAHDTWAAVFSLQRHASLSHILRAAIDLRGDTDSVAALAVGLASLNPSVVNDIRHGPLLLAFESIETIKMLGDTERQLREKYQINV